MADDIVKRLRDFNRDGTWFDANKLTDEAADEIERLREDAAEEIDYMREAIHEWKAECGRAQRALHEAEIEIERLRKAKKSFSEIADEWAKHANDFSVRLARADAEIMRLREARSRALWLPIETAPKWEKIEKRGIYKDGGDGLFFFSATHWRPICNDASKAKTDT